MADIGFFVACMDGVVLRAGSVIDCTHAFILNFYGILATYITLLIQSIN